mgnify:CR=1 FL=1
MRDNSQDETLKRNYLQKYRFLIAEYELVKAGQHPQFDLVQDFYTHHDTDRRSFRKYYNRYLQSGDEKDLLPQKRGPKWKSRRAPADVEAEVEALRKLGMGRYEIVNVLRPRLKDNTPSPSGVYNILKRKGLNRLSPPMKEEKRKYIKEKAGEMAHLDCHHLSKCLISGLNRRHYLVCVIDDCTRVAWAEIVEDLSALTVMFAVLRCFNILAARYDLRFQEALTDNGPEMGTKGSKTKRGHPLERLFEEMGIKHRYTRPYRPQTNGKVERFWRSLEDDLLRDATYDSVDQLRQELNEYLCYYNHHRPHQALGGNTPAQKNSACPRIT